MGLAREEWLRAWGYADGTPEADEAWSGKQAFDARHDRSAMVMSDYIDPVLSHVNGKMYDSKSALYASYLPSGNPQGVRYECVGEKVAEPYKRPSRDKNLAREAVARTLSEMGL